MKPVIAKLHVLVVTVALQGTACMECNTEACGVLDDRASTEAVTQGLAGAGVLLSDVIEEYLGQTCRECLFHDTRIRIWKSTEAVTTAEQAAAVCGAGQPDFVGIGDPWYEVALDVGSYLACNYSGDTACIGFSVAEGKITTLHDGTAGMGPFYLSQPGGKPEKEWAFEYVPCVPFAL